jgi:hypothetical protein
VDGDDQLAGLATLAGRREGADQEEAQVRQAAGRGLEVGGVGSQWRALLHASSILAPLSPCKVRTARAEALRPSPP